MIKDTYICWDCKRQLNEAEEFMQYKTGHVKCKSCHITDPILRNFQETEVYSRIVGYIRPVKQWNPGKKEEYKDRKEYKL